MSKDSIHPKDASGTTTDAPWESDHEFDAECALVVLKDIFSHVNIDDVVEIGEGWDFRVFVANDKWVFRFPKRNSVIRTLRMEQGLLPLLGKVLSVAVPQYTFIGHPHRLFPYEFAGYDILPGMPLSAVLHESVDMICVAKQVGAVLADLHSLSDQCLDPIGGTLERVTPDEDRIHQRVVSSLYSCKDALSKRTLAAVNAHLAQWRPIATSVDSLVLVHKDLRPEHIMIKRRESRLTGIIDWSDASFAAPWTDFLWLWIYYGEDFICEVLSEYGKSCSSEGLLDKIQGFGLWKAVNELAFGIQSTDSMKANIARQALEREFIR